MYKIYSDIMPERSLQKQLERFVADLDTRQSCDWSVYSVKLVFQVQGRIQLTYDEEFISILFFSILSFKKWRG